MTDSVVSLTLIGTGWILLIFALWIGGSKYTKYFFVPFVVVILVPILIAIVGAFFSLLEYDVGTAFLFAIVVLVIAGVAYFFIWSLWLFTIYDSNKKKDKLNSSIRQLNTEIKTYRDKLALSMDERERKVLHNRIRRLLQVKERKRIALEKI